MRTSSKDLFTAITYFTRDTNEKRIKRQFGNFSSRNLNEIRLTGSSESMT